MTCLAETTASSISEGAAGPFPSADSVADAFGLLPKTPRVCVQGLGFVGAATLAAVADACDADGSPRFNVVGLDLDTAEGLAKIGAINSARIPIATNRSRKPAGWRISNERTADPRQANAAAGDLHLLTGSPALGYTDTVFSPAVDYDGTPRPAGAEDAGAYERAGGQAHLPPGSDLCSASRAHKRERKPTAPNPLRL